MSTNATPAASNENVIKIGGVDFPVRPVTVTPKSSKKNPTPSPILYLQLIAGDVTQFTNIFYALGNEAAKAKDGLQNLLDNLFDDQYRAAMTASFDPATKNINDDEWVATLLEIGQTRSRKAEIEETKEAVQTELNSFSRWEQLDSKKPDALARLQALGYKDEEAALARATYLWDELEKLNAKLQEITKKAQETAEKRAKTAAAKKAAEEAKKLAAAAATPATPVLPLHTPA